MTNFTQPEALRLGKQAIVFPSPAAASVAVQLAQLVGVAESHGLKKAVQRFLLICFFGLCWI
ncbi:MULTISPECIES: hypothetical protein [Bacilli]|uniref:Uncharacterized protein n=1 Tax=Levilactobacillus fuyuanensis TaxID=2486022 RepID=A0ABW4H777_9LACO|nr:MULTISPECIES: hypothetical protein [Bacilli]EME7177745.1 hypothetical protein [Enterococcus faecium]KAF0441158.1 hypothetical protein GBO92_09290 [Pediococcus pentosaceus]